MADRYFTAHYRGIAQLLHADFIKADLLARAERVKYLAEATAPQQTGAFRRSFYVRSTEHGGMHPTPKGGPGDRFAAIVGNSDPQATRIELGTRDTPKHATLRRALLAAARD